MWLSGFFRDKENEEQGGKYGRISIWTEEACLSLMCILNLPTEITRISKFKMRRLNQIIIHGGGGEKKGLKGREQ